MSGKNPTKFLTRKFSLATKVGFRVRAVEPMHIDDWGKHPGKPIQVLEFLGFPRILNFFDLYDVFY